MKKSLGIYLMFAGILMGFYLVFNVYLPTVEPSVVSRQSSNAESSVVSRQLSVSNDRRLTTNDQLVLAKYEHPKKMRANTSLFNVPDGLRTEVDFWIKIYTEYTTDQAVLHDPDDLGKIYGVISLPHCDEPPAKECLKLREDKIQEEKDALIKKLNSSERPLIRAQVGQKDKFEVGIAASQKFLSQIENVFAEFGIPKEISRLPFVESMFDLKAYSRSRAAGIWQLMPSTAKILGLKVGKGFDERYDPVKATYAAAKHLLRDYKRLGKWDLVINAYNSGPGRLVDAVNKLGTTDIVKIIKRYDNPSYGFAARNFYPCFLAALTIYENRYKYFPELYVTDNPPLPPFSKGGKGGGINETGEQE